MKSAGTHPRSETSATSEAAQWGARCWAVRSAEERARASERSSARAQVSLALCFRRETKPSCEAELRSEWSRLSRLLSTFDQIDEKLKATRSGVFMNLTHRQRPD